MLLSGKRVNLNQLETELRASGITLRALAVSGDDLKLVNESNAQVEPPPAGVAIVLAHVPPPLTDYGGDSQPRDQLTAAVNNIRQYLTFGTPTNAQVIAEVRLLSRCVLYLLQQMAV